MTVTGRIRQDVSAAPICTPICGMRPRGASIPLAINVAAAAPTVKCVPVRMPWGLVSDHCYIETVDANCNTHNIESGPDRKRGGQNLASGDGAGGDSSLFKTGEKQI